MLEFANILIKVINTSDREFKYVPVNSETEKMSLSELISSCGMEEVYLDLVYNDNSKSRVTRAPAHLAKLKGGMSRKNVRVYVLVKLLDAIRYIKLYSGEITDEKRKEEMIKMANNAEYSLYLTYGEEEKNRICREITKNTSNADLINIIIEAEEKVKNNVEDHYSSPSL